MPTTGVGAAPAAEPLKAASPKLNIPPSEATIQYPLPEAVPAIPTMGWLRRIDPVDPRNAASPKAKMPPSEATSQ